MSPALLVALQLIGSMGMAKHIPTKMSVMPQRPTIERATAQAPDRAAPGIEGAQRTDGTRPDEDYLTMRRAATTTYEPFLKPPIKN
jgi:hypothetical protein